MSQDIIYVNLNSIKYPQLDEMESACLTHKLILRVKQITYFDFDRDNYFCYKRIRVPVYTV